MKKTIFLFALLLGTLSYETSSAQVNVNINIGSQPVWGPAGYDYAEYYYLPDMDVYYHVPDRQFIFFDGRNWIFSSALPAFYNRYDLYNCYKVVINEPSPYLRADLYRSRYYSYRGRRQANIYNSRDSRYFVINGHPEHERWLAARNNNVNYNSGRFYDNRPGNYGRIDDRRFDNRGFMDRSIDDRKFDDRRFEDRRVDNNQRSNDYGRNNMDRNNNFGGNNDNRHWQNDNDRRIIENNRNGNNDRGWGRRY